MSNFAILGCLAAFDFMLVGIMYVAMKSQPLEVRRQLQVPVSVGTVGFIFHTFMFFSGAILVLQLAMIAGMWGIAWYLTLKARNESP